MNRRLPHALKGVDPGDLLQDLEHLTSIGPEHTSWPLAWEWAGGIDGTIRPRASPRLPGVFISDGAPQPSSSRRYFAHLQRGGPRDSPTHARLASQLAADLSQYLVVTGAPAEAMEVALWATEVKPDSSAHWVQLGVACSSIERGHTEQMPPRGLRSSHAGLVRGRMDHVDAARHGRNRDGLRTRPSE